MLSIEQFGANKAIFRKNFSNHIVENNNKVTNGIYEYFYQDNIVFECEFIDGLIHGEVSEYSQDGTLLSEGFYTRGKKDSLFKFYNAFGILIAEINYKDGEKDGKCVLYYTNGNVKSETFYTKNKKHGSFLEYYENGSTKFCANYVFDKIEGHATEWHEADLLNSNRFTSDNRKCKYGFVKSYKKYKFGKLNGYSSFYNKDSFLEKKELYMDGCIRKTCN